MLRSQNRTLLTNNKRVPLLFFPVFITSRSVCLLIQWLCNVVLPHLFCTLPSVLLVYFAFSWCCHSLWSQSSFDSVKRFSRSWPQCRINNTYTWALFPWKTRIFCNFTCPYLNTLFNENLLLWKKKIVSSVHSLGS